MFQVLVILYDWILIKQIIDIVSFIPLFLAIEENRLSKNCTCSFEGGTEAWVKMHRFDAFSNVNTINWKCFSTLGGIHIKFNKHSGERQKPKEFKEIRMYPWGQSWRTRVVNNIGYQFVGSNLGAEIFLKKREIRNMVRWNRSLRLLCTLFMRVSRTFHLHFTLMF